MSEPIRVTCLTHAFPRDERDPVGLFVLQLIRALVAEGIEMRVVAPAAPGVPMRDVVHGVAVRRYRYAPRALETLAYTGTMGEQVSRSLASRAAFVGLLGAGLRAALSEARESGAQLVHAHWWIPGGLVGAATARVRGIPLVTTMHGSDVRLIGEGFSRNLFRAVAARSSAMTAVSSWLAETASAAAGRQVIVAPMPVRSMDFVPGPAERPARLLFVGKLTEQKGLHHLLRALARCRTRPELEVVGAGRVDDTEVRRLASELGLADRITWLPILPQPELAGRYREAMALVIPAIDEGLGLTAIEAALSETPVIAFASGGLTDCVVDGETGSLVSPRDIGALASAIDAVVSDPTRARALGRAGRVFALDRFGERAVAARYAALYRNALDSFETE